LAISTCSSSRLARVLAVQVLRITLDPALLDHHRPVRELDHFLAHAAQDEAVEESLAVGAHEDERDVLLLRRLHDLSVPGCPS
jgi:hypothetical protein